jgi:hypothetical protein
MRVVALEGILLDDLSQLPLGYVGLDLPGPLRQLPFQQPCGARAAQHQASIGQAVSMRVAGYETACRSFDIRPRMASVMMSRCSSPGSALRTVGVKPSIVLGRGSPAADAGCSGMKARPISCKPARERSQSMCETVYATR